MARPRKYNSPEELKKDIDAYFEDRFSGDEKIHFCSIVDLCNYLGIGRKTFYRYGNRDGYDTIIKEAKNKIISVWEQQLMLPGRNTTGAIFWLKNFAGMADKVEHQHSGRIEHDHRPALDDLPADKLEQLSDALQALDEPPEDAIDVTPED